jgi:hypothetical protein
MSKKTHKTNLPKASFSIYKIDLKKLDELYNKDRSDKLTELEICNEIINDIKYKVKKENRKNELKIINSSDFLGIVYNNHKSPLWFDVIDQILNHDIEYILNRCKENSLNKVINKILNTNELKYNLDNILNNFTNSLELTNKHISYILFKFIKRKEKNKFVNHIFAMTGGYGSHYISNFTEKKYGLNLIPKLVDKNTPIIKKLDENNFAGNVMSNQRRNINTTSISIEQDLTGILKELNIEVDEKIAQMIGINKKDKRKTNIVTKDSLIIGSSLSIEQLNTVLNSLADLENISPPYTLNYFKTIKDCGIKKKHCEEELINLFFKSIKDNENHGFVITGGENEDYFLNGSEFNIVNSENDDEFLKKNSPITLENIFEKAKERGNVSKTFIKKILKKFYIQVLDGDGNDLLPTNTFIIDILQGFFEIKKENGEKEKVYLLNGLWHVFGEEFINILNSDYKEIFEEKKEFSDYFFDKYDFLKENKETEEEYNNFFKNKREIIFAHKAKLKYVEIADLIIYDKDEDKLYLIHNKSKFDGVGVRDLFNQIEVSSIMVRNLNNNLCENYYDKICHENGCGDEHPNITKENFTKLFDGSKKICYVAGFIKNYRKDTRSTYAKFLVYNMNKKMKSIGYEFMPTGLNFE